MRNGEVQRLKEMMLGTGFILTVVVSRYDVLFGRRDGVEVREKKYGNVLKAGLCVYSRIKILKLWKLHLEVLLQVLRQ